MKMTGGNLALCYHGADRITRRPRHDARRMANANAPARENDAHGVAGGRCGRGGGFGRPCWQREAAAQACWLETSLSSRAASAVAGS